MPEDKPAPENDASRERSTVTEPSGSPFPDPGKPKPRQDVEVVPGQPMPATDRPDDGGIRAVPDQNEKNGGKAGGSG